LVSRLGFGETMDRPILRLVPQQRIDVDAVGVVERAIVFADADDLVTLVEHQLRGIGTHVAEALHDDPATIDRHAEMLQRLVAANAYTAPRGLTPSSGPAHIHRLAGHHRGHRLPHVHGVGVHDPRHRLFVGIHVRSGNIFFRSEKFNELRRVAPRHAFELALRHLLRIADHAALGSAEWNVDHSTLPRHPACQRAHFVQRHIGRVTYATLAWSAGHGVQHTVAGKNLDGSIVHPDRDVNDDFARRTPQYLPDSGVE